MKKVLKTNSRVYNIDSFNIQFSVCFEYLSIHTDPECETNTG